ncbi:MAG: SprT family zinc-dependent metalloprotease [Patescibacteria group bacterium]
MANNDIPYSIKRSKRARRMRLAVYCDGSVVVTLPQTVSENIIDKFLRKKMNWVLGKIAFFKQIKNPFPPRLAKKDYLKYKNQALELAIGRVNFFNTIYKFNFNKINIRNQKTRWGSCSTKGNLNFNYKILFLSERVRDYVIVHEICHLKQFNHSKNFWNLVEIAMPDYVEIKKELKKNYLRVQ